MKALSKSGWKEQNLGRKYTLHCFEQIGLVHLKSSIEFELQQHWLGPPMVPLVTNKNFEKQEIQERGIHLLFKVDTQIMEKEMLS